MRPIVLACLVLCLPAEAARRRAVDPVSSWSAALALTKVVATGTLHSSSKLAAQWTAKPGADRYVLTATETAGGAPLTFSATGTSTVLTALESGTEYRVTIQACVGEACVDGGSATATTDEEVWQIRGTGSSFATADRIVSDGNTKPFALLWGAEAGATLAGRAQLYYDPNVGNEKGIKIGTMNSVSSYTPLSGFGFRRNDSPSSQGFGPATFQVVALSARLGAKVRLFYEANATGGARVFSVDSRDGWQGRDFHSGAATICQESDLVAGGACAPTLLIGVAADGNAHVREARQLKVGLPTLSSWTWDEEPGTFMVVTLHLVDRTCGSESFQMGYAVWDGTRWNLQYDAAGCPKRIGGVQAPFPVHVGGARYKLYFNHNASTSGVGTPTSFKPLRLLYADGSQTGEPSRVDFEDWETIGRARRVNVLWPSGAQLTDDETSIFDDYQVWMPTSDPSQQVIYSNMTCRDNACGPPFTGMAVLLNP